jgi:hypothetical protein
MIPVAEDLLEAGRLNGGEHGIRPVWLLKGGDSPEGRDIFFLCSNSTATKTAT